MPRDKYHLMYQWFTEMHKYALLRFNVLMSELLVHMAG